MKGAIICERSHYSWKAARGLGILSSNNPVVPIQANQSSMTTIQKTEGEHYRIPTIEEIMAEHPAVFDGQVRVMEGEQFTITLKEDAIPFCTTDSTLCISG